MTTILLPFIFSSVMPASFIQIVPKTFGLYQINPTKSDDNAARINAKKLKFIMVLFKNCLLKCTFFLKTLTILVNYFHFLKFYNCIKISLIKL